ncbi:Bsu YqfO NIF3/CutA domain protein [Methylophaga frappieri]|uniref:Bsu YqfO NIF3/CutA domain protein n=1 Tax=Methylophaga frappieri (strain ATCC BAA-2434 / DSM 25690 / JAM7) TaxID=754477 RepID=I1YEI7_METFJ|nr:NIF3 1 [Methylophaga frappieri]AFJ01330.1 Bsu YqfO NIF3/CutA domain protein [Methylophaga frappieri]
MHKLVFFVPESHKERVKQAVFDAGAGRFDGYQYCSWESLGTGQFQPMAGSQPFIGQVDEIERVSEYRVEVICPDAQLKPVITALLLAHPYETPAYECWPIKTLEDLT